MKNRIELYKTSIDNFISENLSRYKLEEYKTKLTQDHTLSIIALTIISNLNKKMKRTLHGYYISLIIKLLLIDDITTDIKLLMTIIKIMDDNILLLIREISSEKIVNINCLSHEILTEKMILLKGNDKLKIISQLTIIYAWIFGCGMLNKEIIQELNRAGEFLANLIEITNNFDKTDYDNQFDNFVKNKQKFIEIMVTHDIYSDTMKNIINSLEDKIDN